MPVTNYHTCNGRILGETTAGVRTDYLTDALGSVTATVNSSQTIVNTYRYKPYGEQLAKTGVGADPRFLWTGDTGSRTTLVAWAEQYNRARHFGTKQAQWTTMDPLWPTGAQRSYALVNPTTLLDPDGDAPEKSSDAWRRYSKCVRPLRRCIEGRLHLAGHESDFVWEDICRACKASWGTDFYGGWPFKDCKELKDWFKGNIKKKLPPCRQTFHIGFPIGVPPSSQFQYGFCCGHALGCGCDDPYLDCADFVCWKHDQCLASPIRVMSCAKEACEVANGALLSDCCKASPDPENCVKALRWLVGFMCGHQGIGWP